MSMEILFEVIVNVAEYGPGLQTAIYVYAQFSTVWPGHRAGVLAPILWKLSSSTNNSTERSIETQRTIDFD